MGPTRWQALFDDLEAQVERLEASELRAEVSDRTRTERGRIALRERLTAVVGQQVKVQLGESGVRGRVVEVGVDWLLVDEASVEALVPLAAALSYVGLSARSAAPAPATAVVHRLDLRWALRGLVRDRVEVAVTLRDGSVVTGTLDHVGLDHVDVAEHAPGEPRRSGQVRQVRVLPLAAVGVVRSR